MRRVAADPASRVLFVALAAVIILAYNIVLPFAFTQRLSVAN